MKQSAISNNIYAIRNHYGYTQESFAKLVGVSQVTVSKWETSGHDISDKNVRAICNALPVTYDDIKSEQNGFAKKVNRIPLAESFVDIPLYGSIAAGTPIEMISVDEYHPVPIVMHDRYPNSFLLRVKGTSMDRILPDGCYALVDPCKTIEHNGDPYAVCVNGYDATIKRVRKLNNGFELVPDSTDPTYPVQTFNYNEPGTETITVIGRVVYYVLPFDWGF